MEAAVPSVIVVYLNHHLHEEVEQTKAFGCTLDCILYRSLSSYVI
jgi:hypothetical protein